MIKNILLLIFISVTAWIVYATFNIQPFQISDYNIASVSKGANSCVITLRSKEGNEKLFIARQLDSRNMAKVEAQLIQAYRNDLSVKSRSMHHISYKTYNYKLSYSPYFLVYYTIFDRKGYSFYKTQKEDFSAIESFNFARKFQDVDIGKLNSIFNMSCR